MNREEGLDREVREDSSLDFSQIWKTESGLL